MPSLCGAQLPKFGWTTVTLSERYIEKVGTNDFRPRAVQERCGVWRITAYSA